MLLHPERIPLYPSLKNINSVSQTTCWIALNLVNIIVRINTDVSVTYPISLVLKYKDPSILYLSMIMLITIASRSKQDTMLQL